MLTICNKVAGYLSHHVIWYHIGSKYTFITSSACPAWSLKFVHFDQDWHEPEDSVDGGDSAAEGQGGGRWHRVWVDFFFCHSKQALGKKWSLFKNWFNFLVWKLLSTSILKLINGLFAYLLIFSSTFPRCPIRLPTTAAWRGTTTSTSHAHCRGRVFLLKICFGIPTIFLGDVVSSGCRCRENNWKNFGLGFQCVSIWFPGHGLRCWFPTMQELARIQREEQERQRRRQAQRAQQPPNGGVLVQWPQAEKKDEKTTRKKIVGVRFFGGLGLHFEVMPFCFFDVVFCWSGGIVMCGLIRNNGLWGVCDRLRHQRLSPLMSIVWCKVPRRCGLHVVIRVDISSQKFTELLKDWSLLPRLWEQLHASQLYHTPRGFQGHHGTVPNTANTATSPDSRCPADWWLVPWLICGQYHWTYWLPMVTPSQLTQIFSKTWWKSCRCVRIFDTMDADNATGP